MSRNCLGLQASASRVLEILTNPRAYASFVVGAKRIRRYDEAWPEVGATIHHSFGLGPSSSAT